LPLFPWAEGIISYTRALGAAHTGDVAGAQAEIARLQSLNEKLVEAKSEYWAKQVEVQRLGASAAASHAQGKKEEALELARAAAKLEDSMDKHPATPAAVLPARELLADLLLDLGDGQAALIEYEQVLRSEQNRFRSILGVARAAQQSGDAAKAKDAYQRLLTLSAQATGDRPELAEAKAFLTN
jgi:tetratricopeptide (TPR) repeat protein